MTFGEWLKRQRASRGLTQEQLALQIHCSRSALRKFEAEERRPSGQILERLAEIFNISPDERRAFFRFARGDWRSAPGETEEDRPWQVPARSPRSNLPATVTSLVGREKEIADVRTYLLSPKSRLLTLTGPPGIGKTRLSIESARASRSDFPDGVFVVPLAPLNDSNLIDQAVMQALGFVETGVLPTRKQLIEGIGEKHMLLVLDNCEHLIEGVASLVSDLLTSCPLIEILATSRESLRIAGEWLYPVPAFDFPKEKLSIGVESASSFPALTLFAERARAVRPNFALEADNIQTVATICAHLDGLPLAIELIAARMRLMSPQALLQRLDDQFILSADGMRAASERQKTLNNAIAWSYNLLSAEEQKLFAYLSVFSGGFTLKMAETMFSQSIANKPVADLIASLLDKSLLQYNVAESWKPQYTMLMTIQEFAKERLRQMGEEMEIRDRHLLYFLDLAKEADKELRGPNQILWLQHLEGTRDNLRTALDWVIETKQTETALNMARKLHWFWFVKGDHTEGRQWLGRVLELPETPSYPESQAEVLAQLAHHIYLQVGTRYVRPSVEQALLIARTHADKHNTARGLALLGLVLSDERDLPAAQAALEESKALYQEVPDEWGYAHAVMCLAWVSYKQNDYRTMYSVNKEALNIFRKLGDRYFECVVLRGMGVSHMMQGDLIEAEVAFREALILAQQLDSKHEVAQTLWRFAEVAQRAGRIVRAVSLYWATKGVFDSVGAWTEEDNKDFVNYLTTCQSALGEVAFEQAVEEGDAMTMEQAITYALENSDG